MTTELDTYRRELLLALRLRDMPGPQIAERLAEVDSHVVDTGEGPREAFGAPRAYANELCRALGQEVTTRSLLRGWFTWQYAAIAALAFVGPLLLVDGVVGLAGASSMLGIPPVASTVLGMAALTALVGWLFVASRRNADRVIDPRSGADMAGPAPRWAFAVLIAAPVVMLVAAVLATTGR